MYCILLHTLHYFGYDFPSIKKSIDIAFLTVIERCIAKNGNYFQPSKKSNSHGSMICCILLQYALTLRNGMRRNASGNTCKTHLKV